MLLPMLAMTLALPMATGTLPSPDLNQDGIVDRSDYILFLRHSYWVQRGGELQDRFDMNVDGELSNADLKIMYNYNNQPWPQDVTLTWTMPTEYTNGDYLEWQQEIRSCRVLVNDEEVLVLDRDGQETWEGIGNDQVTYRMPPVFERGDWALQVACAAQTYSAPSEPAVLSLP